MGGLARHKSHLRRGLLSSGHIRRLYALILRGKTSQVFFFRLGTVELASCRDNVVTCRAQRGKVKILLRVKYLAKLAPYLRGSRMVGLVLSTCGLVILIIHRIILYYEGDSAAA